MALLPKTCNNNNFVWFSVHVAFYKQNYKGLFWSKNKDNNPKASYEKNLFVNFAHGSRGLGTAILGANLITDLVLARSLCIERSLFFELHPARFLIRKLKKGLNA